MVAIGLTYAWHVHSNKAKNAEIFTAAELEKWNIDAKAAGDRKLARQAAAGMPTDAKDAGVPSAAGAAAGDHSSSMK